MPDPRCRSLSWFICLVVGTRGLAHWRNRRRLFTLFFGRIVSWGKVRKLQTSGLCARGADLDSGVCSNRRPGGFLLTPALIGDGAWVTPEHRKSIWMGLVCG